MSNEQEEYHAVLKASYAYTPQSEDEIEIKEDQLLLLVERVDDDWWKVKPAGDSEGQSGLIPSAYVEEAEPSSVVKAQYDYDAAAQGEISLKEEQTLLVFGPEEEGWLLVQEKDSGKVGYIPANYVEILDEASTTTPAQPAVSQIVIPDSPPRPAPPVSTYVDPAERVRSTASKVKADAIKTWAISEIDKKGKKKKGTLGVGNGAIFFASEADKTPVRKWQIGDITSAEIDKDNKKDKSKHVLIEVGGAAAANLHFHAGNKDTAEEILAKLQTSRSLARESTEAAAPSDRAEPGARPEPSPARAAPIQRNLPPPLRTDGAHSPSKKEVHFSEASPAIIPPRSPSPPDQPQDEIIEGLEAVALYDFQAQGEDELTAAEGDALWVIEQEGDEWWKCRNVNGDEGVVPASYVEPTGAGRLPTRAEEPEEEGGAAEREAEERAAAERAEQEEKEKEAHERKAKQDQEQRARATAAAAEAERKRKDKERRDREERDHEERAGREKEREDEGGAEEEARREKRAARAAAKAARAPKSSIDGRKSVEKRAPPDPSQTREWRDRSGQFRVEAAFLGYKNGVLRLHKVNGVIIEVPSEKMSAEDIRHVEKITGRGGSSSRKTDDDDEPLSKRQATVSQKKAPQVDWFEFFLNAGCDVDDCTRYATSFERDKIDDSILPDITEGTLRTLGLREGDIIRVTKAIESRRPKSPAKAASSDVNLLGGDEAATSARATPSPGPPNLFTGPGGQLKNARRGRPTPSKSGSTIPGSVDLGAISTASEQIARSTTPLVASPTAGPTAAAANTTSPVQVPSRSNSAAAASGFDDDAWTNRPSSTKPVNPTPTAPERVPSVPPLPGTLPASSSVTAPAQPPRAPSAPVAQATSTGSGASGAGLSKATEADIFDQLARLSQLRVQNPSPAAAPVPASALGPSPSITSTSPLPVGYNQGLGVGSSPSPLGQHLHAQQTGLFPPPAAQMQNGPRGPFAPVPANQGLLAPLVPTSTGFGGFVPTRPATSPSSFLGPQPTGFQPSLAPQPTGFQPSLAPQPTGFQPSLAAPQPTSFQPSLAPQPTGFQPSLAPQPTGFQPSLAPQPTGFQPSFAPRPTGFGVGSPFAPPPPVPPLPSSFQNGSFNQLQPQPTGFNGFNTGYGQSPFGNGVATPPVPPLPPSVVAAGPGSAQKNTNPANVFAAMKAGTFANANDSAPQSADKYAALRVTPSPLSAQPTGWGFPGFPGGYSGFQR